MEAHMAERLPWSSSQRFLLSRCGSAYLNDIAAVAPIITQMGILAAITERVRFARARMGTDELINGVLVLIGDALCGEPTLPLTSACFPLPPSGLVWPESPALACRVVPLLGGMRSGRW
jgi:hypothetical protein